MSRTARGLALGLLTAAMLSAWAFLTQPSRFRYDCSDADPHLSTLLSHEDFALTRLVVAPQVQLRGIVRRTRSNTERFVLLFPGNTATQLASTLPLLKALCGTDGTGGATFAYRGFDGSTGTPSPSAAAHDARIQLAYVRDQLGVPPERIVLVGFSMGSGIALRLAAELAQTGHKPAASVLLSPFWSVALTPASRFGRLMPSENYLVEDITSQVSAPVLIVGAARDPALPVATHARRVASALGERARYLELPNADHVDYLTDEALLAQLRSFIRGTDAR